MPADHQPIPAMVTIPTEAVLDAVGAFFALDNYFGHLAAIRLGLDGQADDTPLGEWCIRRMNELKESAFGVPPAAAAGASASEEDHLLFTWPPEVEQYVRGEAMTAELLRLHVSTEAELADRQVEERIERAEAWSARIRKKQSTDPFNNPSESEADHGA